MSENNMTQDNEINVTDDNVVETEPVAEVKEKTEEKFNLKKEIFSWIRIIVFAVVIAYLINNFIIINANVPTGSMENTILPGDRMIGLRTAYLFSDPQRGDIVIFKFPDDETQTYVKRVIGMPGDKVVIKDAKVYINDSEKPLDEPYLPEEWTYMNGSDEVLEYNVPEDSYFVMGDNRNHSADARGWINKYVKKSKIIAKAEFKYWPWNHKGLLKSADYVE
jgi:signal peptidase I